MAILHNSNHTTVLLHPNKVMDLHNQGTMAHHKDTRTT